MTINRNDIDKYIFNINKPKECIAYKALLNIARREVTTVISPYFLKYFLQNIIFTKEFHQAIYDMPDNYDDLSYLDKINLYISNNSIDEFKELVKNSQIDNSKIFNYSYINNFFVSNKTRDSKRITKDKNVLDKIVKQKPNKRLQELYSGSIFSNETTTKYYKAEQEVTTEDFNRYFCSKVSKEEYTNIFLYNDICIDDKDYCTKKYEDEYSDNVLIFSIDCLDILKLNIKRNSIFITDIKHKEFFLENNSNPNIKPLFLKNLEDVDILLDSLVNDLEQSKLKKVLQESIEYIDSIEIENLFSIKNIRLSKLKDKKEIYIVGNNGDGKTLLLQAIAVGLKGIDEDGLKEFRKKKNEFTLNIANKEKIETNFFAYGSSRYNFCKSKEDKAGYLTLFSGEYDLKEPTEWLIELYNAQNAKEPMVVSLDNAIKLLQKMLNRDIEIIISYNSVTFKEKHSDVTFEQLSAGYRGVITIVCDLIDRFSKKQQVDKISEFKGVVVIDEVELHLHPKWQYSFIQKLRETFPKVQFIVTTHSPTVLLGASIDAVYYQIMKKEGVIAISSQLDISNNFLNDIQSNIFGFDVNSERINIQSEDEKRRQKRAKEAIINLIKTIKDEK